MYWNKKWRFHILSFAMKACLKGIRFYVAPRNPTQEGKPGKTASSPCCREELSNRWRMETWPPCCREDVWPWGSPLWGRWAEGFRLLVNLVRWDSDVGEVSYSLTLGTSDLVYLEASSNGAQMLLPFSLFQFLTCPLYHYTTVLLIFNSWVHSLFFPTCYHEKFQACRKVKRMYGEHTSIYCLKFTINILQCFAQMPTLYPQAVHLSAFQSKLWHQYNLLLDISECMYIPNYKCFLLIFFSFLLR